MSSTAEQTVVGHIGETVTRVTIDHESVGLLLGSSGVNIDGSWALLDTAGVVIDSDCKYADRRDFMLWKAIGTTVVSSIITQDNQLHIVFSNGLKLEARSDNDGFEDWQLIRKKTR